MSSGTALTASNFVEFLQNYVADAKRELTALETVKLPTGPAKETGSITSNGAVVTSAERRTSTGRSSLF